MPNLLLMTISFSCLHMNHKQPWASEWIRLGMFSFATNAPTSLHLDAAFLCPLLLSHIIFLLDPSDQPCDFHYEGQPRDKLLIWIICVFSLSCCGSLPPHTHPVEKSSLSPDLCCLSVICFNFRERAIKCRLVCGHLIWLQIVCVMKLPPVQETPQSSALFSGSLFINIMYFLKKKNLCKL